MAVDFSRTDIYSDIQQKIQEIEGQIAVLVNNVGTSCTYMFEFATNEDEDMNTRMVLCNVYSTTKMCEIVLARMKNQKRGIVINISSAAGVAPVPYFSTYSSTKAFVSTLSKCLAAEYSRYGITIQDVTPNQVVSNLTRDIRVPLMIVEAKSFVKYALRTVGKERQTNGHPKHKILNNIFYFLQFWLPESIVMAIALSSVPKRRTVDNNNS